MDGVAAEPGDEFRETVRFYLLDHRTVLGKAIDIALLLLNVLRQASKILKEWTSREKVNVTCPECGLSHHDSDASHCKACGHVVYQEYDPRE